MIIQILLVCMCKNPLMTLYWLQQKDQPSVGRGMITPAIMPDLPHDQHMHRFALDSTQQQTQSFLHSFCSKVRSVAYFEHSHFMTTLDPTVGDPDKLRPDVTAHVPENRRRRRQPRQLYINTDLPTQLLQAHTCASLPRRLAPADRFVLRQSFIKLC